jgi:hypothetical protein
LVGNISVSLTTPKYNSDAVSEIRYRYLSHNTSKIPQRSRFATVPIGRMSTAIIYHSLLHLTSKSNTGWAVDIFQKYYRNTVGRICRLNGGIIAVGTLDSESAVRDMHVDPLTHHSFNAKTFPFQRGRPVDSGVCCRAPRQHRIPELTCCPRRQLTVKPTFTLFPIYLSTKVPQFRAATASFVSSLRKVYF